jgi:hypothetical protein
MRYPSLFWLLKLLFPKPFIPFRCEECDLLYQCRDTKRSGKCYNGCLKLKQQQKEEEFKQMIEYYEKHTTYLDK